MLFLFAAIDASAVDARKITSYWGYYVGGNGDTACNVIVGPSIPPEVIGQKIRECDGTTWSWGNTTCTYYTPTVEYEGCGASATAPEGTPADGPATPIQGSPKRLPRHDSKRNALCRTPGSAQRVCYSGAPPRRIEVMRSSISRSAKSSCLSCV